MKDEIKEMLELFSFTDENIVFGDIVELNSKQSHLLLDYITNLEQELQEANETITWWSNRFKAVERDNERLKEIVENLTTMTVCGDRKQIKNTAQYKLDIYKSRNEKAIEYNYELQERYCHSALFDDLVASKIYEIAEKNIKLLYGDDE